MTRDIFAADNTFSTVLSGPVDVTATVTAGVASVTVTQGAARWSFYDRAAIDCLLDALMRANAVLEVAQAERGECGVCSRPDVPLCDTVPRWINDSERESVARCYSCCEEMDAQRSVA